MTMRQPVRSGAAALSDAHRDGGSRGRSVAAAAAAGIAGHSSEVMVEGSMQALKSNFHRERQFSPV